MTLLYLHIFCYSLWFNKCLSSLGSMWMYCCSLSVRGASCVFVTLFSTKWLNCQSPCNYLKRASTGSTSDRLRREYWICTSIRALIKCRLHMDSRLSLNYHQCTTGGRTAGRTVKASGWKSAAAEEVRELLVRQEGSIYLGWIHAKAEEEQRIKRGETTWGRSVHVWLSEFWPWIRQGHLKRCQRLSY